MAQPGRISSITERTRAQAAKAKAAADRERITEAMNRDMQPLFENYKRLADEYIYLQKKGQMTEEVDKKYFDDIEAAKKALNDRWNTYYSYAQGQAGWVEKPVDVTGWYEHKQKGQELYDAAQAFQESRASSSNSKPKQKGFLSSLASMVGFGGDDEGGSEKKTSPLSPPTPPASPSPPTPSSSPGPAVKKEGKGKGKGKEKSMEALLQEIRDELASERNRKAQKAASKASAAAAATAQTQAQQSAAATAAAEKAGEDAKFNQPEQNKLEDDFKEKANQFNSEHTEQALERAQNAPPANFDYVKEPRLFKRLREYPEETEHYHGPFDRGTFQPVFHMKEAPYDGMSVWTARTAKQVANENAKRRRLNYVMYDSKSLKWTNVKKKDLPPRKKSKRANHMPSDALGAYLDQTGRRKLQSLAVKEQKEKIKELAPVNATGR